MRAPLLLLSLIPSLSSGAVMEYKCLVHTELSLDSNGTLKPYRLPQHLGKTFDVDRLAGTIVGAPLRNLTAGAVRVLQKGDSDHTFQLLSLSSPTGKVTTDFLTVLEFVPEKQKPFLAMTSGGVVYAGVCE